MLGVMYEHAVNANQRDRANREELICRIAGAIRNDGTLEPIPGLHVNRQSRTTEPMPSVARPSFCVIAQGAKEVCLGDRRYRYDPAHYLLTSVELPAAGRIIDASPERPYLSLRLDLDPALVGSVMLDAGVPVPRSQGEAKAVVVSALDTGLLDAAVRLVQLLDAPEDARVLAPLVKREIVYRLLVGEQGHRLRHLPAFGEQANSVSRAVEMLRKDFDRPLNIENLARQLGMSSSGFHHHFKAITDMSPLQFQKQLRLQEARRLMVGELLDAATAGYRVGYYDPSHFSRDYKRYFGAPPARDADNLRALTGATAAASAGEL
jgi:AraC-like DNA-binding protein